VRVEGALVLIQLLLPTSGAAGADAQALLAQTRRELAERFTRVTAYVRSPAKGLWTAPDGQIEQDDVVMVEVVTDTFERAWWRTYAATLAERFVRSAFTSAPFRWNCWNRASDERWRL